MDRSGVFVGLDYHQGSVQVCVMDREGQELMNRACANDWMQIVQQVGRLGSVQDVAMEACAGTSALADQLVQRAGWSVSLAHPGYVKRIKQSPDKSDFSDAKLLADLVRVGYLPKVWLAPEAVRQLRELVRFRQQLVGERRSLKLRIGALLRNHRVRPPRDIRPWTKPWRFWLEHTEALSVHSRWVMDRHLEQLDCVSDRITQANERLVQATADDAVVQQLRRHPGIGPVTSWVLRAEIGRFDRFQSGKQLSRFCGLSPCNASSGPRQADAGLVKAGNRLLRATLIETAHRLRRQDPRWMGLSQRMARRGKPGSVIAAAVGNRWVRWLYWQMRQVA